MSFAESYKQSLVATLDKLDMPKIQSAIEMIAKARNEGKQIFVSGNGGSAASASHFVCDMLKGASYGKEKRFKIMALHDNMPTLTAYSNDVSYIDASVEQLKNFANPGDVVIAISGSGNSPNVLKVMEYANSIGCQTITMTGRDGGKLADMGHLDIRAAEQHMGRIEDAHMMVCHMICYYFMDTGA